MKSLKRLFFPLALAATFAAPAQTPSADAACKAFVGQWVGAWSRNSQGQRWLHVSEVSDQCVAKYAYLEQDREPKGWLTATIADGSLSMLSRSNGGTTTFKLHGNELWANYSSASGNTNNQAVFKRVEPAQK